MIRLFGKHQSTFLQRVSQPRAKRGFTIAELSVVLALTVIISAIIVSLCVLVSAEAQNQSSERDCQSEIVFVESVITNWVQSFDYTDTTHSYSFYASKDKKTLYAKNSSGTEEINYLSFNNENGKITRGIVGSASDAVSYDSDIIKDFAFTVVEVGGHALVAVDVTYEKAVAGNDAPDQKEISFVVAARVSGVQGTGVEAA